MITSLLCGPYSGDEDASSLIREREDSQDSPGWVSSQVLASNVTVIILLTAQEDVIQVLSHLFIRINGRLFLTLGFYFTFELLTMLISNRKKLE